MKLMRDPSSKRCYVYAYYVNGELWLVGKGSAKRDQVHLAHAQGCIEGRRLRRTFKWHFDLADAIEAGAEVAITRLAEGLAEEEAYEQERRLILELKPLKNVRLGGHGNRLGSFLPFEEAKAFVQKLGVDNLQGWRACCRSLPADIPRHPWDVYSEWVSLGDWLGTGRRFWGDDWRPWSAARAFVHSLHLKNKMEWAAYASGTSKPVDIPSNPDQRYPEWTHWGEWLGNGQRHRVVAGSRQFKMDF